MNAPVARNFPLAVARFGAIALGQQVDMWLATVRLNLLRLPFANFTYPEGL